MRIGKGVAAVSGILPRTRPALATADSARADSAKP